MSGRYWAPRELAELASAIGAGHSDAAIARRLRRSVVAIQVARKRHDIPSRLASLMSARDVARRLGVSDSKSVVRWIEAGWLNGRRGEYWGPNRRWYVTERALMAFMVERSHWARWKPERMPESSWRRFALALRGGDRWLSTREVGALLGVGHATVHRYIVRGLLPAVRHGNWFVHEADVRSFVPPCMTPRPPHRPRRFTAAEDAQLVRLRSSGATWERVAVSLGRSISSCFGRWHRLGASYAEGAA